MKIPPEKLYKSPSKHFLFSKTSLRRLEDVFSVTLFVFQDVLKTSSRRICDTSSLNVFKTSSRRLPRRIFLEDKKMLHWRRLQDVFSTFSPRRMFAGQVVDIWFPSFRCYLIHLFTLIQYTLKINQTKQFGNIYVI